MANTYFVIKGIKIRVFAEFDIIKIKLFLGPSAVLAIHRIEIKRSLQYNDKNFLINCGIQFYFVTFDVGANEYIYPPSLAI